MIYDYIIVGSGLGGLAAGLNLVKHNKKVLILEQNSLPGGYVTTFKKGRFEFDTALFNLYNYGDHGELKKCLDSFNIEIHPISIILNNYLKTKEENLDIKVNGGIEEWFIELEKIVPKSVEPLKRYLPIIKEVHEAYLKIAKGIDVTEEEAPNFYKYLKYNVYDALKDLGIPKNTISLLGYTYLDLKSPLTKISFIDFTEHLYQIIFTKNVVLKEKNLSFVLKLVKRFESLGGKIYYRSKVINIQNSDDIKLVTLDNNEKFKAKKVICNLSNRYILSNLINEDYPELNKLENARTLAPHTFTVYLGLNKSVEDLGLTNYRYDYVSSLNSEKSFYDYPVTAFVPNIVNEFASPNNTTILVLKTFYFDSQKDFPKFLIKTFEEAFNLDISEYIEEMAVKDESDLNYMPYGYDNVINRILSYDIEQPDGIYSVGSSHLGAGEENAFLSGIVVTNKLLQEEKDEF